jgi:hypothetical protein
VPALGAADTETLKTPLPPADPARVTSLAGALYLASTIAFCTIAIAVGVRLLVLWRRTRAHPELLLGLGILLTAGLGYGLMVGASLTRLAIAGTPQWLSWTNALGWLLHDSGVILMVVFVIHIFRPTARWARLLAGLIVCCLCFGLVLYALDDGFVHGRTEGFGFWVSFAAIGSYPLWSATESLIYWRRMQRRREIGLADPIVTNRFLLWGIASICTAAAVWTVTLPALIGLPLERQQELLPLTLLTTSCFGIGAVTTYWLAFLPPRWYSARLLGEAALTPRR